MSLLGHLDHRGWLLLLRPPRWRGRAHRTVVKMSSHCCQIFAIPSSTREHMHRVAPTHPSRTTTATTHTSAHATTRFTRERDRMMLLDRNFHHHQLVRFSHSHTHTNTHTHLLDKRCFTAQNTRHWKLVGALVFSQQDINFLALRFTPLRRSYRTLSLHGYGWKKKNFPLPFPPSLLFPLPAHFTRKFTFTQRKRAVGRMRQR